MRNPTLKSIARAATLAISASLGAAEALAASTTEFTLKGGALIELVFLQDGDAGLLPEFETAIETAGGDYLVGFDVVKNLAKDHSATRVAMVQWSTAASRAAADAIYADLGTVLNDTGFFVVQADTAVALDHDKIYDFTSAWTIAKTPEEMGIVMQVIGHYFQKIGPIVDEYEIATRAFMMRHPAGAELAPAFTPQITGLFEWRSLQDHARFQNDPRWLEHVDIRNAVLARKEDILLMQVAD